MTNDDGILGRGLAFPPRVGADGRLAWSAGEQNIRECVQVVIATDPGERLRLPEFGCALSDLLFAPNTTATRHEIAERIRRAVADWEPRIAVRSVEVVPDPDDPESAVATLAYQLIATQAVAHVSVAIAVKGG
ncbi:GPW/gp25 family protein [Streptomyces sp. NPDC005078]|uniref:GPW/gp25 family protein n=1 Tax=unclassified Streptomyces TaxID=2593676 RepID=UPI0033A59625